MPKRILYLENGIGYGGSAICLKLIVSHLDRSKYYPIVVTSRNEKDHRDFKNIAEWLYVPDKFIEREVIKKKVEDLFFKIKILPGRSSEITSSAVDYLINFFKVNTETKKEGGGNPPQWRLDLPWWRNHRGGD